MGCLVHFGSMELILVFSLLLVSELSGSTTIDLPESFALLVLRWGSLLFS